MEVSEINSLRVNIISSNTQKSKSYYWLVIFIAGLTQIGYEYDYLVPQGIQDPLESTLDIDNTQFNLIYLIGDSPTFLAPIILGWAIDKYGPRLWIILSCLVVFIGSLIIIGGLYLTSYTIVLIGRFIFSSITNAINISTNKIICRWSEKNNIGIAMALNMIILRSPDVLVNIFTQMIYTNNVITPMVVGSAVCVFSLICAFITVYFDKKLINTHNGLTIDSYELITNSNKETTFIEKLKEIPLVGWLLFFCSCTGFAGFISFYGNGTYYISTRYGFTPNAAGRILSIIPLISLISDYIVGYLMDHHGNRPFLLILSNLMLLIGFIIMLFLENENENYYIIIPMLTIGYYFGAVQVIGNGSIPLISKPENLGIIYGIYGFFTYSGSVIGPAIFGYFLDKFQYNGQEGAYFWATIYLIGITSISLIISILMRIADKANGSLLSKIT